MAGVRSRSERADYDVKLEEGKQYYEEASARAQEVLADLGIVLRDAPPTYNGEPYDGRLPDRVASMSMSELADLLQVTTQWTDYVGGLHQMFVAARRNFSEQLSMTRAKIRKGKSGSKPDKDDDTIIDSRYVEVNADYMTICEKADITEHVYAAARRDREFVSRAITAAQAEMEAGSRNESVRSARSKSEGSRLRTRGKR